MISEVKEFKILGDHRGQLVALEANRQIPFEVKRVFYIYGTQPEISRGNHSHYKTKQFLVAVHGSCKVTLDDGVDKEVYDLDRPNLGLFQDALIWGSMHDFSPDCVLMVLANDYYDDKDYIRTYDEFLQEVNR
ncbi:FdtA/QdtA family cupin domain-containing protein [bacterium]|nr:FdtA/QdtA family cupin domain-containing protein [bacterium]MBU1990828.1 FdtA/QdtA family cupin domain-containing protein [bacterium]